VPLVWLKYFDTTDSTMVSTEISFLNVIVANRFLEMSAGFNR
jgi:hypothetical protein